MNKATVESDEFTFTCIEPPYIRITQIKLAHDGITVFIKNNGRLQTCLFDKYGLTFDELKSIFNGTITSWKDLHSKCPDMAINMFIPGTSSGTRQTFKELVFKDNDDFSNETTDDENDNSITSSVINDEFSIGFVGYPHYLTSQNDLYAIPICKNNCNNEQDYIVPSTDNIGDESYPLNRLLYINVKQSSWDKVYDFIQYALSIPGQSIITHNIGASVISDIESEIEKSEPEKREFSDYGTDSDYGTKQTVLTTKETIVTTEEPHIITASHVLSNETPDNVFLMVILICLLFAVVCSIGILLCWILKRISYPPKVNGPTFTTVGKHDSTPSNTNTKSMSSQTQSSHHDIDDDLRNIQIELPPITRRNNTAQNAYDQKQRYQRVIVDAIFEESDGTEQEEEKRSEIRRKPTRISRKSKHKLPQPPTNYTEYPSNPSSNPSSNATKTNTTSTNTTTYASYTDYRYGHSLPTTDQLKCTKCNQIDCICDQSYL